MMPPPITKKSLTAALIQKKGAQYNPLGAQGHLCRLLKKEVIFLWDARVRRSEVANKQGAFAAVSIN